MTIQQTIAEHLDADRLGDAVTEAIGALKAKPQDTALRLLLIDLLVLAGDFARADAQAEIATRMKPEDAVGLARLRGLIRGMEARRAWAVDGAVPSFPNGPSPLDEIALRLNLALRAGDAAAAAARLEELDAARGSVPIRFDGEAGADFRDLDDRLPHALEAVTDGGAYLWIDVSRIASLSFAAPARPRDLAYRRAALTLRDGSSADVLVPLIYASTDATDALKLGRATEWTEEIGGLVTGRGQRCVLVGEDVRALGEAGMIEFTEAREPVEVVDA